MQPLTIRELARSLGVGERTMRGYRLEGCPLDSVETARTWREQNIRACGAVSRGDLETGRRKRRPSRSKELDEAHQRARLAKLVEEVLSLRLANKREMAVCVYAEDAQSALSELFARVVERIATIPEELAELCPEEYQATIRREAQHDLESVIREVWQARRLQCGITLELPEAIIALLHKSPR